jgi:probable phosphoglycerate mutase
VQGQLDVPLNDAGISQAKSVSAALPQGRFAALYSSDLGRVRETAAPAAKRLGLDPRLDARLRERHYGIFQSLTYAECKVKLADDYARFTRKEPDYAFQTGESLQDFFARSIECLQQIAERHPEEEVLVFTHGGVLEMAYRHALRRGLSSARDFEIPNAAINWLEIGPKEWKVLAWADCDHLAATLDDLKD